MGVRAVEPGMYPGKQSHKDFQNIRLVRYSLKGFIASVFSIISRGLMAQVFLAKGLSPLCGFSL